MVVKGNRRGRWSPLVRSLRAGHPAIEGLHARSGLRIRNGVRRSRRFPQLFLGPAHTFPGSLRFASGEPSDLRGARRVSRTMGGRHRFQARAPADRGCQGIAPGQAAQSPVRDLAPAVSAVALSGGSGAGGSSAWRELIAGGGALDQPPDQPASAQDQRREHVLAGVAADLGLRGGPIVRGLLRKTPDTRHFGLLRGHLPPSQVLGQPGGRTAGPNGQSPDRRVGLCRRFDSCRGHHLLSCSG